MTKFWKPTAAELVAALRNHYLPAVAVTNGTDEWAFLTEVPSTGSPTHPTRVLENAASLTNDEWTTRQETLKVRNIDVLLLRNWSGKPNPYERVAVEVKISRSDFFRDTAAKRAPWEALTHRFAYCVPEGLVTPAEVPEGSWLLEVRETPCSANDGPVHARHEPCRVHWNKKVKGTRRTPASFPPELAHHFARVAARAETRVLTADDNDPVTLTAALKRAETRVRVLESREYVSSQKLREVVKLVAAVAPQVCSVCRRTIRPVATRYGQASWQHASSRDDNTCLQLKTENAARGTLARYKRFEIIPLGLAELETD